jgi:hypothetical protein
MSDEYIMQIKMSEEEIFSNALHHLCCACELLFELDSDRGIDCAFMADCTLKYVQDTSKNRDPRLSDDHHYQKKLEKRDD